MKHKLTNFDWIAINLIVHNLLINYLNLKIASIQKQLLTAVLERFKKSEAAVYGCSFVAKLSWKRKIFFLKKSLCFLQNIHYLQKKCLYKEKRFYWKIFLLKKTFLTEKNINENVKNLDLIWKICFYTENVCVTNKI